MNRPPSDDHHNHNHNHNHHGHGDDRPGDGDRRSSDGWRLDHDPTAEVVGSERVPVVRLRTAADLVTAVGYLFGYTPPDPSLVVIGLQTRRLVMAARLDLPALPDLDDPRDLAGAWEVFTRPLANSDADAIAVLAYTDPTWNPALHEFTAHAPLPVRDLLRIRHGRWWTLTCPHPRPCQHPACHPGGAKLGDDPAVTAPLIAAGATAPGSRDDLAASLRPGPDDVITQVTEQLRTQPARTPTDLYQALCQARHARTGGPDPLSPGQAAVLLTALTDVRIRDACLAWTDSASAWWLWHDLIRTAPPGHVAPVAMLIAVAAYQRGDGVTAAIATDHALTDRPGYGLARLIRASLHHALPPQAVTTAITEALETNPLTAGHPTEPPTTPSTSTAADPPEPTGPSDADHHRHE